MYQQHPSLHHFHRFKKFKDDFDRHLNRYNRYVERRILEGSKRTSFYKLLNAVLKRPETLPSLKDDTGNSAITAFEKVTMLAVHFFFEVCSNCPVSIDSPTVVVTSPYRRHGLVL